MSHILRKGEPAWGLQAEWAMRRRDITGRWLEKKYKIMNELALELDAFADCIRRNREPGPSGAEGLRDVAVIEAIYQSAREGRAVSIAASENRE